MTPITWFHFNTHPEATPQKTKLKTTHIFLGVATIDGLGLPRLSPHIPIFDGYHDEASISKNLKRLFFSPRGPRCSPLRWSQRFQEAQPPPRNRGILTLTCCRSPCHRRLETIPGAAKISQVTRVKCHSNIDLSSLFLLYSLYCYISLPQPWLISKLGNILAIAIK